MSSVKKTWYRVVDPLNPLCGCDVRLCSEQYEYLNLYASEDGKQYAAVTGLRRLDVLMGDRPFQLVNRDGDIGVFVDLEHLEVSPIQDDVVEIGYDLPNGKCLSEEVLENEVGRELRVATYERATQVAYGEPEGDLYATCMLRGDDRENSLKEIVETFDGPECDHDELVALMKMRGR